MVKYYNIRDSVNKHRAFNFIIGGRRIGKTYSLTDWLLSEYKGRFLYIRNTEVQIDESCGSFGNPFKKYSKNTGRDIRMRSEKNHAIIEEYTTDETGAIQKTIVGYAVALSTITHLRGVDFSDVDIFFFDEFIEDRNFQFNQYKNFMDLYETANSNRELEGLDPVRCYLLSNAQRLANPILRGMGLIPVIEDMMKHGQRSYTNGDKHIELPESEVSKLKENTALYRAIGESDYKDEALHNKFANDSFSNIEPRNINEFTPLFAIDDIYVYRHKSSGKYYATTVRASNIKKFNSRDHYVVWYKAYAFKLRIAAASDLIEYDSFSTKADLLRLLKL